MRRAFKTGSTRYKGPTPWFRRAARCSFSSCAKTEQHSGATLMKNDVENGRGVPAPHVSRRKFMLAAAATGGAGLLSAVTGGAGLLPAGLVAMNAHGSDDKAAPFVLPKATEDVTPFKVSVPQSAIDDLKRRLASTRWPERETVGDWSQGVPLQKAQALVAYWRDKYDWRRFEARINAFPQYRTQIDGVGIHFIHMRSPQQNALPIILTHGWPGSLVEFMEIIGPLSDPTRYGGQAEDAFHVVVPSLPGFAFSDKPVETGWGVNRIARAWATLMPRLGYERWVAQGGDWGAGVTHALAHQLPPGLIAAHVNWQFVFPEKLPANPTPAERKAIDRAALFTNDQSGYFREQGTRPQTIGYPLADSAAGQALWPNLFYWNELDRGGHFAAFEQPKLFTEELRKAFRSRRG